MANQEHDVKIIATLAFVALTAGAALGGCGTTPAPEGTPADADRPAAEETSAALVAEGQQIFRFDTFGDEQVWTDTLRLHEVVEKSVDPTTALKVGLKVDADVLPPGILDKVDLKSPATTVALLKMNAVVASRPPWTRTITSRGLASPARSATPPWTTQSCPASATGWTAGRIGI